MQEMDNCGGEQHEPGGMKLRNLEVGSKVDANMIRWKQVEGDSKTVWD